MVLLVVGGMGFCWFFRGILGCEFLLRIVPALKGKNALGLSQLRFGPAPARSWQEEILHLF